METSGAYNLLYRSLGIMLILMYGLFFVFLVSCSYSTRNEKENSDGFPYKLSEPDTIYRLPHSLREISGLAWYKENKLLCVQDEKASIYVFNTETAQVVAEYEFGEDGDFEGIAVFKDTVYALRSDGTLFIIKNFESKYREIEKVETRLNKSNNTEGLCFDKHNNVLLISNKNKPGIKENVIEGRKAVYSFDRKTKKVKKSPEYLISLSEIATYKERGAIKEFYIKIIKQLNLIDNTIYFQPSGIAIPPGDDENIYILSHVGKLLIVINRENKIQTIHSLNSNLFKQPEGISFDENGILYISNEGNKGTANILKFSPNH